MKLRTFISSISGFKQSRNLAIHAGKRNYNVLQSARMHTSTNPKRTINPDFSFRKCFSSKSIDESNITSLVDSYDTYLIDLDGTMWGMDHITPISGIPDAVESLRRLNKRLLFVTNNSIHGNLHYTEKFRQYGFDAPEDDIFGVAHAAAIYLKEILNVDRPVYVIGSYGMAAELDHIGLDHFGVGPDTDKASWDPNDLLKMELRDNVGAVLVGYDMHFHYNKMFKAASYLLDEKCHYVATNDVEKGLKIAEKRFQPVTGTLVDAISASARREPKVVGKPHPLMLDCVRRKHNLDPSRTLFIGDSIKSDISFANNVGIDSALVLTGANKAEDFSKYPGVEATFILDSFASFRKI